MPIHFQYIMIYLYIAYYKYIEIQEQSVLDKNNFEQKILEAFFEKCRQKNFQKKNFWNNTLFKVKTCCNFYVNPLIFMLIHHQFYVNPLAGGLKLIKS